MPDDRGGAAVAMSWVNRITGGSLLLLLPVVAGYWLDQYLQTEILFLIIGSFLGVAIAACHLWRIVQDLEREGGQPTLRMVRDSGNRGIILVLGKHLFVLAVVFVLIFGAIGWLDGWLNLGVPGEVRAVACFVVWLGMSLAAVASIFPRGDEAAGLRLGLATFCRTGIPLLHVLVIMFNYPAEISEIAMGYIAICYLIGFPLSIALSLGDFPSSS